MAEPQLENGFTQIANELVEAFCQINLSSYESRVLWCMIRKTYGWKKKSDKVTGSQIVAMTGISKGHVSRALKALMAKNIVTNSGKKQIGIQKNYEEWKMQKLPIQVTIADNELPIQVTEVTDPGNKKLPIQVTEVTDPGNKKLPIQEPQNKRKKLLKENKETIQKKPYGQFQNILLTNDEYQKLKTKFSDLDNRIEALSEGIESKGYKYKSHYATILTWARREDKEKSNKSTKPKIQETWI